jgi:hypothetical protein
VTALTLHLQLVGLMLVVDGVAHIALPALLDWRVELAGMSVLNRQVAYVHCFFIGLACLLFGALPLSMPELLVAPGRLATAVLVGCVGFWGARLIIQLTVFGPAVWRGRRRLVGHLAFTAMWAYVAAVFTWALGLQLLRA